MKKRKGILFGFTVALAAVMLNFAGCDTGSTTVTNVNCIDDWPDTYTHATPGKIVLADAQLAAALQYLADTAHYGYINRSMSFPSWALGFPLPWAFNPAQQMETQLAMFDPEWRAPIGGRVYRGPFWDPITRSAQWMSINPNGSINSSLGSYFFTIPPNTVLEFPHNELQGYEVLPTWQIGASIGPGQTTQNFIERRRGTFAIEASLIGHPQVGYGAGLGRGFQDMPHLFVEVRLRNHAPRQITAHDYYHGNLNSTVHLFMDGDVRALSGWGVDAATLPEGVAAGPTNGPWRSQAQFWNVGGGAGSGVDAAVWNLTTPAEREAYLARVNQDPRVAEVLSGRIYDMWFDILQIVLVTQEQGFDYEQWLRVNALLDRETGYLRRMPADWGVNAAGAGSGVTTLRNLVTARREAARDGVELPVAPTQAQLNAAVWQMMQRGRVVLQNERASRLAYWSFYLNFDEEWWWSPNPETVSNAEPVLWQGGAFVPHPVPAWYTGSPRLTAANLHNAVPFNWDIGTGGFTISHAWDGVPLRNWGGACTGLPLRTLNTPGISVPGIFSAPEFLIGGLSIFDPASWDTPAP